MRVLPLLAVLTLADAVQPRNAAQILAAGEHHGHEVPLDARGAWFALLADPNGASLRRVRVSVTTVKDEIVDEGDEMTGKRVDVSPAVEPIVLVRGVRGLRSGGAATVLLDRAVDNETGVTARLGPRSYRLFVRCGEAFLVHGQRQETCDLLLWWDGVEQTLFTYPTYYDGTNRMWGAEHPPNVIWAGDLNADGRLDLLLDTSVHYNVNEMRLYVSTDDSLVLVTESAAHTRGGC